MEGIFPGAHTTLKQADAEIYALLEAEKERQWYGDELNARRWLGGAVSGWKTARIAPMQILDRISRSGVLETSRVDGQLALTIETLTDPFCAPLPPLNDNDAAAAGVSPIANCRL